MYKCVIADDQMIQRDLLTLHLGKMDQIEIVASSENGLEAYKFIQSSPVDLVFSDINMPELSGLELLKSLKNSPVFIFISDHPEYAAESYGLDVIDYIVKPVSFERLLRSVNKAIEYLGYKKEAGTDTGQEITGGNADHFFIKDATDIVKIRFQEIAYIESMGNFSKLHLTSGKQRMVLVILKNMESQLPSEIFTRVHKQYIINHDHLSTIGTSELVICDKFNIPVSQSYRQLLIDKIVQPRFVNRSLRP